MKVVMVVVMVVELKVVVVVPAPPPRTRRWPHLQRRWNTRLLVVSRKTSARRSGVV